MILSVMYWSVCYWRTLLPPLNSRDNAALASDTDMDTGGHGKTLTTSNRGFDLSSIMWDKRSYPDLLKDNGAKSKATAFRHKISEVQVSGHLGVNAQYSSRKVVNNNNPPCTITPPPAPTPSRHALHHGDYNDKTA